MSSLIIAAPICLLAGIALGWVLFRSERAYHEGFLDGERYGRAEGFKTALQITSKHYLLNPQTGDWYYH